MIITDEFICKGSTSPLVGSWNRKQIELLGLRWPTKKGWKSTLIGKYISDADAAKFLALSGRSSPAASIAPIRQTFKAKDEVVDEMTCPKHKKKYTSAHTVYEPRFRCSVIGCTQAYWGNTVGMNK